MSKLQVGFGREIYNPDTPQPQNSTCTGYSVLTAIMVTCVAISDGEQTALIFSNDLRNHSPQFIKKYIEEVVDETGVPAENILVSTTHNHSAPDVNFYQRRDEVTDWGDRIAFPAIRRAAKAAMEDLTPVEKVTGGKDHVETVTYVRRYFCADGIFRMNPGKSHNPTAHESEADTELRAIRFHRGEEKKDVVLTNFQVHAATALGASKGVICADFLHAFRQTAEARTKLLVCYLQGGCGNLNTYSRLDSEACNTDYDKVGRLIAEGMLRALENAEELNFDGFSVQKEYYTGIVNHTRDHLVEKARETLKYVDENKLTGKEATDYYYSQGFCGRLDVGAVLSKSQMEKTAQIPLSTVCFGEVGMTFAPFEQFDQNCQQIRAASPFKETLTVGYTNFRHHYLPTAYGFMNGGYEAGQCYYIPGTGETVALEFLRMLKQAKKKLQ